LLLAAALISLVGAAIAVEISWVHSQIASLGDRYTSFCNVNSSINCDAVLSSDYSKVAGIPVAWLALLAYLALAAAFLMARKGGRAGSRLLGLAAAGTIGSVVFSLYMALVSALILKTICLLCTSLYVVSFTLALVVAFACREFVRVYPGHPRPLTVAGAIASTGAALVVTAAIGLASSGGEGERLDPGSMTLQELQSGDPNFYAWYFEQPIENSDQLVLSDDEAANLGSKPVVLIDYSDFECPSCRRNWNLLEEVLERRGNLVHVVHRNFPLDAKCNGAIDSTVHRNACRAAEAAQCASLQGLQHEVSAELFGNQPQLFETNIFRLAERAGVDKDSFRVCMEEHKTLEKIVAEARSGEKLKLSSTPTLFLNRRRIKGTFEDVADYERAILIEAAGAAAHK
jgi:uncharacterized membrane protein/protein-disulfide isomerase